MSACRIGTAVALSCAFGCASSYQSVLDDVAPSTVCVVRHAESYKNLPSPPPNRTGPELDTLTPDGQRRADGLAAELPEPVAFVWTSPAGRAKETAERLSDRVSPEVRRDLRPLGGDLPPSVRRESWLRGLDPRPPGGESLAEGRDRAQAVLRLARRALGPDEVGVLVSHGFLVSLLLGELRNTPLLERPEADRLATGEMACEQLKGR